MTQIPHFQPSEVMFEGDVPAGDPASSTLNRTDSSVKFERFFPPQTNIPVQPHIQEDLW